MISRRALLAGAGAAALGAAGAKAAGFLLLAGPGGGGGGGFNNGKSEVNLNDPEFDGEYPFLNFMKAGETWIRADLVAGGVSPAIIDVNGYPTSNGGHNGVQGGFFIPLQQELAGFWRLKWTGTCKIWMKGWTGHSSPATALTGTNQTFYIANPAVINAGEAYGTNVTYGIVTSGADAGGASMTELAFTWNGASNTVPGEHSLLYDQGKIFNPTFLTMLSKASLGGIGEGVIRPLNWNGVWDIRYWADRRPLTYIYYKGQQYLSANLAANCTNSGRDFSCDAPSYWGARTTVQDKDVVHLRWSATIPFSGVGSGTVTLNVGGSGAIVVTSWNRLDGTLYGGNASQYPTAGAYTTLMYDAALNYWIRNLDDNGSLTGNFFRSGVPYELWLELAKEVGAHPWFPSPHYAADDPNADFHNGLSAYCLANAPSWMIPRAETPNETWNSPSTPNVYAVAKGAALWPGNTGPGEWTGMAASIMGQAWAATYSNNTDKYQVVVGQQASAQLGTYNVNSAADRLECSKYIGNFASPPFTWANNGSPSKNWITHLCIAAYVENNPYDPTNLAAWEAACIAGDVAAQNAALDAYIATLYIAPSGGGQFTLPAFTNAYPNGMFPNWKKFLIDHASTTGPLYGIGGKLHGTVPRLNMYEGALQGLNGSGSKTPYQYGFLTMAKLRPNAGQFMIDMFNAFVAAGGEFPSQYTLGGRGTPPLFGLFVGGIDDGAGGAGHTLTVTSIVGGFTPPGTGGPIGQGSSDGGAITGTNSDSTTYTGTITARSGGTTGGIGTYTVNGSAVLVTAGTLFVLANPGLAVMWSTALMDIYEGSGSVMNNAMATFNGN